MLLPFWEGLIKTSTYDPSHRHTHNAERDLACPRLYSAINKPNR
jgi:hypothetical protein